MAVPPSPLLVLFGGRSNEHQISCVSAGSVLAHLDPQRFEVVPVGISRAGEWLLVDGDADRWRIHGRTLPEVTDGEPVALLPDPTRRHLVSVHPDRRGEIVTTVDAAFPVLHGPGGEDGEIQGLLETAGVPYVGSGVCASAASMDKAVTKALLRDAGIPTGDAVVLPPGRDTLTDAEAGRLGLPVFVKPARAGSSVGISRVASWPELPAAIALARSADAKVLVEAAVVGREIECAVLAHPDGRVEASLPAEIRVTAEVGWYDFDTKYLDEEACDLDVPAKLDDDVAGRVRELAVAVFAAMGCAGLARVDFFLTADGGLVVNELNTMPGFTSTSLYPRMWATTGIDYPSLLSTLVATAGSASGPGSPA